MSFFFQSVKQDSKERKWLKTGGRIQSRQKTAHNTISVLKQIPSASKVASHSRKLYYLESTWSNGQGSHISTVNKSTWSPVKIAEITLEQITEHLHAHGWALQWIKYTMSKTSDVT